MIFCYKATFCPFVFISHWFCATGVINMDHGPQWHSQGGVRGVGWVAAPCHDPLCATWPSSKSDSCCHNTGACWWPEDWLGRGHASSGVESYWWPHSLPPAAPHTLQGKVQAGSCWGLVSVLSCYTFGGQTSGGVVDISRPVKRSCDSVLVLQSIRINYTRIYNSYEHSLHKSCWFHEL